MMKYILGWIAGFLLLAQTAFAGNYSYIYIEGDKQTPFYVKMEGQMQPRLGKNYCIIPNLAAGVTYLEILFQQNAYPPQKFAVNIPEGGSRGFVLQKVNDRQFALYDMQQGNYIVSGNKPEDDHVPDLTQQSPQAATGSNPDVAATPVTGDDALPAFEKKTKKPKSKPAKEQPAKEGAKDNDRFIGDMELNTDNAGKAEPLPDFNAPKPVPVAKGKKKVKTTPKTSNTETSLAAINDEETQDNKPAPKEEESNDKGIPNSDCKTPMSSEDFESFALKILDKTDDDARIKVLSRNKGKQCFTTEQVRIIANNLDTQSGRYDVVKMLYAQTSDQSNYYLLESLFKTNYLKNKFKEIINPK